MNKATEPVRSLLAGQGRGEESFKCAETRWVGPDRDQGRDWGGERGKDWDEERVGGKARSQVRSRIRGSESAAGLTQGLWEVNRKEKEGLVPSRGSGKEVAGRQGSLC